MSFEQTKLGEVIKHRKGFITIDDDKEYKLCRVQLHRRGVVLREVVKGSTIRTKKQQVCKAGDFLVAEMDAKVGGYGFVPKELDGAIVSSHYFLFELDEKKIRPKYLEVLSQLQILQDQIKAVGSTNYAAIRPANVLNWEIPITNINKQKSIESLFDSTRSIGNELSGEFSNQQDLLAQLRQAFLREAMQGKLVKQDPKDGHAKDLLEKIKAEKARSGKKEKELPPIRPEEAPFEIPKNWVWCRLGEVGRITGGGTPSMSNSEYWNGDIPWVSPKDMGVEFVFDTEMKVTKKGINESSTNLVPIGSLLIVGRSGILKRKLPVAINKVECTVNQDMKVIIPYLTPMNRFLQLMFNGLEGIILKGYVKFGMTVHSLRYDEFALMPIPLPPHKEQTRIVKKLEELMMLSDELQKSIQTSREQNELLLQQVLKEALIASN